jgi:hypothetical protein
MDKAIEDIVFGMADTVIEIQERIDRRILEMMAYPTTSDHPQYGNPDPDPPIAKPPEEEGKDA